MNMQSFYMVRCKQNGVVGWLDDELLFTTNTEYAALFPTKESAKYHIKVAMEVNSGLGYFRAIGSDAHFRPATKDLQMCLDNSN